MVRNSLWLLLVLISMYHPRMVNGLPAASGGGDDDEEAVPPEEEWFSRSPWYKENYEGDSLTRLLVTNITEVGRTPRRMRVSAHLSRRPEQWCPRLH